MSSRRGPKRAGGIPRPAVAIAKRSIFFTLYLGCCGTVLAPQPSFAQETTGRLEGRVLDAQGRPVESVQVRVTSPALQGQRATITDKHGDFELLELAVGEYWVRLSHIAYQPREISAVRVWLGRTTTLGEIRLEDRVHPMSEVVASARRPLLDPRSTTVGGNLVAQEYAALPVDRDYKTIAALLPHANASVLGDPVNYAGATGLENRYFVDGIDVTDPYRNATGMDLPYNFVRELQVRTGAYQAEYASSLGGTLNVVTPSGGNDRNAEVFGFLTGNGFSATPRSIPNVSSPHQSYSVYDFGFGTGGLFVRDRLWYYVAYSPSFDREDVTIPGMGDVEDRIAAQRYAAKLSWRPDERNAIVVTSIGDPKHGRDVQPPTTAPANVDPFVFDVHQGGFGVMLEGRHTLSERLLVKTTLSRSWRREDSEPESQRGRTEPFFVDSTGVAHGGGPSNRNRSTTTSGGVTGTWRSGDHVVKAGAEYSDRRLEFDNRSELLIQLSSLLYYYQRSSFRGHVGSRMPSAFVQDAWRPYRRLQLNAGLRWQGQSFVSSQDQVAQSILDEWQPRVGVAYQLGARGTQVFTASYGRYYQDLTTSPLFWYYNAGSQFFGANYDHDPRADASGADTTAFVGGGIQPRIDDLEGQHFDEFTVGYERELTPHLVLGIRGIHRRLLQGIEDGIDPVTGAVGLSNPGRGALGAFPDMTRRYLALETEARGQVGERLWLLGSYVLSRNSGNYEGLFDSRYNNPYPNTTGLYDVVDALVNADGPLPNDRTHVLKLSGSYRAVAGLTLGFAGSWQSGTPLSELGGTAFGPPYVGFIGRRGSAGRTPSVWDLDARITWAVPTRGQRWHPRLMLDFFHIASKREAVRYDEVHYSSLDAAGNEANPNPNYGKPTAFQPPMAIRLGFESAL
jgi:hypothetical protein